MKIGWLSGYFLVFLLVVSLLPTGVCADQYVGGIPLETIQDGMVSGGLWYESYPVQGTGRDITYTFTLPDPASIEWARLYVAVYCGHMQNNYEGRATVDFNGGSGMRNLGCEDLRVPYSYPINGGSGPVRVNDHCNRVTSDYLMWYDVGSAITSNSVAVRVRTDQPEGYTGNFDGRIKVITLVIAYNDGDGDEVYYWINQGHDVHSYYVEEYLQESYVGETTFCTGDLPGEEEEYAADLSVVYIASCNGEYAFNEDCLDAGNPQGSYSGYQTWDVTDLVQPGEDSILSYNRDLSISGSGGGYTGAFFKIPLALLSVRYPEEEVGSITITSQPSGAAIFVDDEETGYETPSTISGILVGDHSVRVEKENYLIPEDDWVFVELQGNESVHFELEPIIGSISVDSEPEGAWVWLDDTNQSIQTPATLDDLLIGEYTIEVRMEGYEEIFETVNVEEGETTRVFFELVQSTGYGSDSGSETTEGSEEFGYEGKELRLAAAGTVKGNLSFLTVSDYSGLLCSGESVSFEVSPDIPPNATIDLARMYVYTTWGHDDQQKVGVDATLRVDIDGKRMAEEIRYRDRKSEGIYDYLLETAVFDLTETIDRNDQLSVTIKNAGRKNDVFAVYGIGLLLITNNPEEEEITYWICEGSDAVYANPQFGTESEDCITLAEFNGDIDPAGVNEAQLILVSTAASGQDDDEHRITFNEGEWFNLLSAGSSAISVASLDVRPFLSESSNLAEIQSYITTNQGDYIENRNIILVLRYSPADSGISGSQTVKGIPVASPETAVGDSQTVLLNFSEGRALATHIMATSGDFEIFIAEGTSLQTETGNKQNKITLRRVDNKSGVPADAVSAYEIGPEGMQSDIPMLLIFYCNSTLHPGIGGDELSFARYTDTNGTWDPLQSRFDPEYGTLSCHITEGGRYAVISMEKSTGTVHSNPLQALWDFILDLFGLQKTETIPQKSVPYSGFSNNVTESDSRDEIIREEPEEIIIDHSNETYSLNIRSSPPGALVYINGTYIGKVTPCTVSKLNNGEYTLRLERGDLVSHETIILLSEDTDIAVELSPPSPQLAQRIRYEDELGDYGENGCGGVYVDSYPRGASIYVDGSMINAITPYMVNWLKEGTHSIKVAKEGLEFPVDKKRVWVQPGMQTIVLFDTTQYMTRSITIDSDAYKGQEFTINGIYQKYRIPRKVDVEGSGAFVSLRNEENACISIPISDFYQSGDTFTIKPEDYRTVGLYLSSEPAGAEIFVDGFDTGYTTPYLIENISEGPHRISMSKTGYIPDEKHITVLDDPGEVVDLSLQLKLEPYIFGSLTVTSEPDGAKIYIFKKDTGKRTPWTFPHMDIGRCNVKVVGENGSVVRDVDINPYTTSECHFVLNGD